jgi:hypothetical protein
LRRTLSSCVIQNAPIRVEATPKYTPDGVTKFRQIFGGCCWRAAICLKRPFEVVLSREVGVGAPRRSEKKKVSRPLKTRPPFAAARPSWPAESGSGPRILAPGRNEPRARIARGLAGGADGRAERVLFFSLRPPQDLDFFPPRPRILRPLRTQAPSSKKNLRFRSSLHTHHSLPPDSQATDAAPL